MRARKSDVACSLIQTHRKRVFSRFSARILLHTCNVAVTLATVSDLPTWPEYLQRVTDGATNAEISRATGVSPSTVGRWRNGETKPSTETLEKLAQRYPIKLEEAIRIVAAYQPPNIVYAHSSFDQVLRPSSVPRLTGQSPREHILAFYSDLELAQEIVRRIETGFTVEHGAPLPFADTADDEQPTNVHPILGLAVGGRPDDLAEVASESIRHNPDDTDDLYDA
jgi:transcriptional regulator with XRE-family HTH domain